jgi:flagellar hook-length control protein FliK
MPEIALPPASLPVPAGPGPAASPGDNAHSAADSPFAAVLEKQVAAGATTAPKLPSQTLLPNQAADTKANGTDSTDTVSSLLPDLLALLGPQGVQSLVAPNNDKKPADDATALTATAIAAAAQAVDTAVPLGIPAIIPPQPLPLEHALDSQLDATRGGSTGSAESAILAGVAGAGIKAGGENGGGKGPDAALVATIQEQPSLPRAEATTQHPTIVHAQQEAVTRLEAPVGSRQWDGEFANKLAWVVTRNEQRADLVLTPPQLGRIEVSVSLNGDQASATFTSANPIVREAIEGAMPRLREVLLEAGINLGQTHVGSESPQQSPGRNENRDNQGNIMPTAGSGVGDSGASGLATTAWVGGGRGMIDVFA